MRKFGAILQVVALGVLFDASRAHPAGHEMCYNQRFEHKNCDFGGAFIAHHQDEESGIMIHKPGQKRHQQDNTYVKLHYLG
jgi:hypothetical protein